MRVLITGSGGLIGTALRRALEADGDDVVCLVRREPRSDSERYWDPTAGALEVASVEGFDAVVHMAGAGIGDRRWSQERKTEIMESRTRPTRLLVEALAAADRKPEVLITGSAIGYYGERDEPVTETSGPANPPDFLSDLCVAWEAAASTAGAAGIRTVPVRTGLVLSREGGALGKMLLPFRMGVGGRLGSGTTWWSWISIDDHIRAMRHILETPIEGPVNLTSPRPVRSVEMTDALGRALRRPTLIPVPRFGLEVLLGKELAGALLFTSARVMPAALEGSGFEFRHSDVEMALREVLAR